MWPRERSWANQEREGADEEVAARDAGDDDDEIDDVGDGAGDQASPMPPQDGPG
jgi:hypothetical protein